MIWHRYFYSDSYLPFEKYESPLSLLKLSLRKRKKYLKNKKSLMKALKEHLFALSYSVSTEGMPSTGIIYHAMYLDVMYPEVQFILYSERHYGMRTRLLV